MKMDAPCHNTYFYESRCRSPRACSDFGHCRNRNVQSMATRSHERHMADRQRLQALGFAANKLGHARGTGHAPYMWRHLVCLHVAMEDVFPCED